MEVESPLMPWTTDYLTGRPQYVHLQHCVSDRVVSNSGATGDGPLSFSLHPLRHRLQLQHRSLSILWRSDSITWPHETWILNIYLKIFLIWHFKMSYLSTVTVINKVFQILMTRHVNDASGLPLAAMLHEMKSTERHVYAVYSVCGHVFW